MGQSRVSGHFITFEGGEGAGKSTQIKLLAKALRTLGYDVVETREPGGSAGAEALRHVILSGAAENFGPAMEAILFAAARNDHVNEVIRPAVERGAIVLCDRYMDSTRVYQGSDGALTPDFVKQLEAVAIEDMVPDLTIILDIDPREGMKRAHVRRGSDAADRFEKETIQTHEDRRNAYLAIAVAEPDRFVLIPADRTVDEIANEIALVTRTHLSSRHLHHHDDAQTVN